MEVLTPPIRKASTFTGFKTATTEELPDDVAVMDPFHAVRMAGDAMDECRRRVQQTLRGHRGRKGDPLYTARGTLHAGADLHTDKQRERIRALFAADEHVELEATWGIYQRMIAAYREPDRAGPHADEQADPGRQQRRARRAFRMSRFPAGSPCAILLMTLPRWGWPATRCSPGASRSRSHRRSLGR